MSNPPPVKPRSDFVDLSIATAGGLALALVALFLVVVPLSGKITATRDFVVFWATGQQFAHHANPYDTAAMDRIERHAGLAPGYGVLYMRNPPWALPLVLPLGFLDLRVGGLFWSLLLLGCLLVSGRILWQMHGRPSNRTHWLLFSFAPAVVCLIVGQTAIFALLGLVLFEHFYRRKPFAAGMALWLCSLKPHLFLAFALVLAIWIVVTRSFRILAGALAALAASSAATCLLAPSAWTNYTAMMHAPAMQMEFIPCVGVALRLWLNPAATWLQYLPAAGACLWATVYYWRRRAIWNWQTDGSLLALVSLASAPYCWLYDQVLALPALLVGAYSTRQRWLLAVLALLSPAILASLMGGTKIVSGLYVWTAPIWLIWYVLARASARKP